MRKFILIILMFLSASVAFAQEQKPEKGEVFTTVIDGLERIYKVYLPENLRQGAPLVFVLHGYGAKIEHVEEKGFSEAADKYGFAIAHKFVGKKNGPQVWLYEVVGGVHSWFNEDLDTAGEIWKFFSIFAQ